MRSNWIICLNHSLSNKRLLFHFHYDLGCGIYRMKSNRTESNVSMFDVFVIMILLLLLSLFVGDVVVVFSEAFKNWSKTTSESFINKTYNNILKYRSTDSSICSSFSFVIQSHEIVNFYFDERPIIKCTVKKFSYHTIKIISQSIHITHYTYRRCTGIRLCTVHIEIYV